MIIKQVKTGKERPMEQALNIGDVIENTREEILFAIKERMYEDTGCWIPWLVGN